MQSERPPGEPNVWSSGNGTARSRCSRWCWPASTSIPPEPSLEGQIERVSPCDLLLVEGYKHYPVPKLQIWRRENGKPLLHPDDKHIVAIASDTVLETELPRFDLNDHDGIGNFGS